MSQYLSLKEPVGGDENKGPTLHAVNLASFCLAALVVLTRICYRASKLKNTSWDDYTIFLSTAAAVNTAFIAEYVENGGGRHSYYLGAQALEAKKWSTIAQIPFIISTTMTKLSIALMIVRVSTSRRLKWTMAPLITIVVGVNCAGLIILTAGCRPFAGQWNYTIAERKCWSRAMMMNQNWLQGMVSTVSDFVFTLMPIFVVWNLNISRRQKLAICGLIGLGLVATGCSIVRMVLYETFTDWNDTTYGFSSLQIWTALEQNLGIVAASLPTLRVFFKEAGQIIATSTRSFLHAFTRRSRPNMNDGAKSVRRPSDLEKGLPEWNDSGSQVHGKGASPKTQSIEDMELKYLGGNLDI